MIIQNQINNNGEYNYSKQHQNQQFDNIQEEPFVNNENIQINPNPNESSSLYQSQNNIVDKVSPKNNCLISLPFINNANNQNNILNNNIQKIEINQNINGNFQNNINSNNYNSPYISPQMNYQSNYQPNNHLQILQRKRQCCSAFDVLGIFIGCILGCISIVLFPFLIGSIIR